MYTYLYIQREVPFDISGQKLTQVTDLLCSRKMGAGIEWETTCTFKSATGILLTNLSYQQKTGKKQPLLFGKWDLKPYESTTANNKIKRYITPKEKKKKKLSSNKISQKAKEKSSNINCLELKPQQHSQILAGRIKERVPLPEKYIVTWIRKVLKDERVRTIWYSGKTMNVHTIAGHFKSQLSPSKNWLWV